MKETIRNIIYGILLIIIIVLSIYSYNLSNQNNTLNSKIYNIDTLLKAKDQEITQLQKEINEIEKFNKFYSKAKTQYNNGIYDNSAAEYNYKLWDYYYDWDYFQESIEYCELARALYSSSNDYYGNAISYFEEAEKISKEKYKELISYYINASNSMIDINWAMYESCEYFESASGFYSRNLWDSGNERLEQGNKKIELHDSLIKTHNSYLSKIEVLEEQV